MYVTESFFKDSLHVAFMDDDDILNINWLHIFLRRPVHKTITELKTSHVKRR